jgi:hypothetical protein
VFRIQIRFGSGIQWLWKPESESRLTKISKNEEKSFEEFSLRLELFLELKCLLKSFVGGLRRHI